MNSLCPNGSYASNHLSDPDGRIIFVWKPHINVTIIHQSRKYMTCRVDNLTADTLFFTAVYAANTAEERNDMWIELLDIQSSLSLVDQSWIVGGDFNEITHPAEHSDPSVSTITPSMSVFNSCLSQLEIRDLRYHGAIFTWSNKCPEDPIAKKLDRALINEAWLDSFPRSLAQFLAPDISDHTPCCITLDFPLPLADTKPFKFFNYLTAHPDFLSMVAEALICTENEIHSLYLLSVKLKELKGELKRLNKENFSKIQKRVSETNNLFNDAHVLSLQQPNSVNFAAEKKILAKLNLLKRVEEEYFRQLSRINWLKSGDLNTSYFHKVAKARKAFNSITIMIGLNGFEATSPEAIGNLAVAHFHTILGPQTPRTTLAMINQVANMIRSDRFSCSPAQAAQLSKIPAPEDITKFMFRLNENKSPGPDGYTSGFYKAAWNILGPEVINAITLFFQTSTLPKATNSTILTLFPQIPRSFYHQRL